jgi:hypothetical protein
VISVARPAMASRAPVIFSNTHGRFPLAARSNEYFTSAALSSRPLWKRTPDCRRNV